MSKKKILMQRFNGTDYDPQYPETHVQNITGVDQTVANNVGVATTDGATVIGEMSEIDYFVSPQGTTTGTSTAYSLTIGSQYTSLDDMDGVVVRVKFHATTGDNPTLNVNGLGAKPILAENGANIPYQIGEGVWATLIWSSTLDGWIVQGWGKKKVFKTELITETTNWVVPETYNVDVRIFGAGGGGMGHDYSCVIVTIMSCFGYGGCGGGGGHMATKNVNVTPGQVIPIIIGKGGTAGKSGYSGDVDTTGGTGGTSSFGTYVSANGGQCPNGGSGGGGGEGYSSGGTASYGGKGGDKTNKGANGISAAGGTGTGGDYSSRGGGGGGGYGGNGGNASSDAGGGGGGYGLNGNGASVVAGAKAGWAAGGSGAVSSVTTTPDVAPSNGGSGICILTYWAWE